MLMFWCKQLTDRHESIAMMQGHGGQSTMTNSLGFCSRLQDCWTWASLSGSNWASLGTSLTWKDTKPFKFELPRAALHWMNDKLNKLKSHSTTMNDLIKSKFRCGIGTAEQNKNQLLCISIPTKFLVAATNSFWLTEVLQKRKGTQESAEERCISGFPCDVGTLLFAEKKTGQAGSCTMRRLSYRKVQIKIAGSGKNLNLLDLLFDFHCWHATVHGFFSKPQACCFSTQWHADMKWNLKTLSSPKLLWWLLAVGLELIRLSRRIESSKNSRNSNGFTSPSKEGRVFLAA